MAKRKRKPGAGLKEEKVGGPPLTPMIDVIFQLLIYFILTMKIKSVEGKLLSRLPKDKGPRSIPAEEPELAEVRIYICAEGDIRDHMGHKKGAHEQVEKKNEKCLVWVDKNEIDWLFKTEDKEGKAGHNQGVYQRLAAMTAEIVGRTPSTQDASKLAPVILDADSEVPYEHIIGAVNACKEVDINNVEFVGNSKFNKYFGKGLTGGQ